MNIVETENLTFSYKTESGERSVLHGIDIEIEKGSFTVIMGHNGSGKSTFAKHLNAILLPSGGSVYVCGIDTKEESMLYALRKKTGMVFQNPDNQIVATVVEEDVAFGLENIGLEYDEMHKRVKEALIAVNMYDFRNHAPHLLSGGQKQRVAIAGILAMRPECIVLDEPTAMLDPVGRREVLDTVKRLNKEMNITIIMITHYMEEAIEADRIVVFDKGKSIMDGTPHEIFSRKDELEKAGLTLPQSTLLADMLKKSGLNIEKTVLSPSECAEEILKIAKGMSK